MGREVSKWFPDGHGGGDTGESPWAVRLATTLITCSPQAGKKDLCPESETSANGLRSPSLSFRSPRLVGLNLRASTHHESQAQQGSQRAH